MSKGYSVLGVCIKFYYKIIEKWCVRDGDIYYGM